MKLFLKIFIATMAIISIVAWRAVESYKRVDLGEIAWYKCDDNESKILHSGVFVIEGDIELWGDYPYLYGINSNGAIDYFSYNLETRELLETDTLSLLCEQSGVDFKLSNQDGVGLLVTFPTLRGQHSDKAMLQELRENLSPKKI